jgi:hypothetical protein
MQQTSQFQSAMLWQVWCATFSVQVVMLLYLGAAIVSKPLPVCLQFVQITLQHGGVMTDQWVPFLTLNGT